MNPQLEGVLIGGGMTLFVSVVISIVNGRISSKQQKVRLIFEKNKVIRDERIVAYQTYLRSLHRVVDLMQTIIEKIEKGIPLLEKDTWEIYTRFIEESVVQKILFSDSIEKRIDDFLTKGAEIIRPISDPEKFVKSIQKLMNDLLDEIKKPIKEEIFQLAKIKEK